MDGCNKEGYIRRKVRLANFYYLNKFNIMKVIAPPNNLVLSKVEQ